MKKAYLSPEFELIKIQLNDSLCVESNPEGWNGDGNYGDGGEE